MACAGPNDARGLDCDWEDSDSSDTGKWYFGLNRTVGSAGRSGTGILAACVMLSDDIAATPPDCFRDGDGLLDAEDPLPLDPFPPFIVNANDTGALDVRLSDGQGGFSPAQSVGLLHAGKGVDYEYSNAVVSDFDNDGRLDFIVPVFSTVPDTPRSLWWFERTDGPTNFEQRELDGDLDPWLGLYPTELDNDGVTDLYGVIAMRENNWMSGLTVHGSASPRRSRSESTRGTGRSASRRPCSTDPKPTDPSRGLPGLRVGHFLAAYRLRTSGVAGSGPRLRHRCDSPRPAGRTRRA